MCSSSSQHCIEAPATPSPRFCLMGAASQAFGSFQECCQVSFNRSSTEPIRGDGKASFVCYLAPGSYEPPCYRPHQDRLVKECTVLNDTAVCLSGRRCRRAWCVPGDGGCGAGMSPTRMARARSSAQPAGMQITWLTATTAQACFASWAIPPAGNAALDLCLQARRLAPCRTAAPSPTALTAAPQEPASW